MNRIQFIIWAGKQGWKHGQTYLNKAWDLFSKSGNIPKPSQILNKAKDLYKRNITKPTVKPENLHAANTEVFSKVTKIPTKFKTRPVESKPPLQLSEKNRLSQVAFEFFGTLGKNNPFKGRDGSIRLANWIDDLKPGEVMKVMKDYGYKPKITPKADGGRIDKPLPTRSRDI